MLTSENLITIHKSLLETLSRLDVLLRDEGISYWLDFGTCLGSWRAGDIIPWDDDIDIAIIREDFEKLINVISKNMSDIVDISTQTPFKPITAPVKLELRGLHEIEIKMKKNGIPVWLHPNVGLDIFIIDPRKKKPNVIERYYRKKLSRIWQSIQLAKWIGADSEQRIPFIRKYKYWAVRIVPRKFVAKLISIEINKNCPISQAHFLLHGIDCEFSSRMNTYDAVFPLSSGRLGNKHFPVPTKIEEYLANHFGTNFMIPPKPEMRITHSSALLVARDSPFFTAEQ